MIKIFLRSVVYLFVPMLLCHCKENQAESRSAIQTPTGKPNVIVILTDDQGYGDLAYHGNPIVKTPNLDLFAQQALELTNFHVGTTCAPTRAGLMTGRNANRNNAWHTIAGCSILLEDEETMPEVFLRNGYSTAMLGKWHLGDNYPFRPQDRGFEEAFYHGGGGIQQTPDFWNNDYFDDTYFRNGTPEKTSGYCTDVWFDEAISLLKTPQEKPFFLYLALNAAHGPFNVPESYAKLYADAPLTPVQKRFYGMISNIDDNFGRLIAHLKKTDQFDNTIIVFTTDNGTAAGISKPTNNGQVLGYNAGLRGTKGSHYDGGHRVPFFISWPNGSIPQETKNNTLVSHVDLLPTLAALTNSDFTPKKPLDGTNMTAILKGEKTDTQRMLVIDTQRNQLPEKGRNPCVMEGPWRLVNGHELYNIAEDPGQQSNIAQEHPERLQRMADFYEAWWADIQSDIRYAEIPIGHRAANPTLLTVHDMHTADNLPWNQVQIRKGAAHPKGYYSIRVVTEGTYNFKLYRYAPESELALNTTTPEISGSAYRDALPEGESIAIDQGYVALAGTTYPATAGKSDLYLTVSAQLKPGSYELRSAFLTSKGTELTPYYTEIEKL